MGNRFLIVAACVHPFFKMRWISESSIRAYATELLTDEMLQVSHNSRTSSVETSSSSSSITSSFFILPKALRLKVLTSYLSFLPIQIQLCTLFNDFQWWRQSSWSSTARLLRLHLWSGCLVPHREFALAVKTVFLIIYLRCYCYWNLMRISTWLLVQFDR